MNKDTTQITTMCRERENQVQQKQPPAHAMARCDAPRQRGDWQKPYACVVCAQGGNAALCNYNESREWECCECDYVQTRCVGRVGLSCGWQEAGFVASGWLWPAGFVCVQVRMNNQQTTGRALGKWPGSLPQSPSRKQYPRQRVTVTV